MFAEYLLAAGSSPDLLRIPYRRSTWSLSENQRMTPKGSD